MDIFLLLEVTIAILGLNKLKSIFLRIVIKKIMSKEQLFHEKTDFLIIDLLLDTNVNPRLWHNT